MSLDPAFVRAAHRLKLKRLRPDGASHWTAAEPQRHGCPAGHGRAGAFFRDPGRDSISILSPTEARLGLAAGEKLGPLGQVFGYWAPDLWPAQGHSEPGPRASGGVRPSQLRPPYVGRPHWPESSPDG